MEISQIGAGGLLGATSNQAASAQPRPVAKPAGSAVDALRRDVLPTAEPRRQALSILRQEIRQVLQANFRIKFAAAAPGYVDSRAADAAGVASEALNGASAAARRAPLDASRIVANLREQIDIRERSVRELVDADDDDDDLDDAMSRIRDGLDDIDDDVARNVESSATVLSAESRLKQRSTIRIRTQEGDIVRFDLRRVEKVSVEDVTRVTDDTYFQSTQIDTSSRSRMRLRVEGDLNDAEYAAVQNVFAQAEQIADEFFGGDLAAAFDMAAGIQFDSEQLARVNMRFRERLESQVAYATTGPVLSRPAPPPAPVISEPAVVKASPAAPVEDQEPTTIQPEVAKPFEAVAEPAKEPAKPAVTESALDGFFDLLANFLKNVAEGFEPEAGASSFRFFYSQSFNLEILRSVLELKAPEENQGAADAASALIGEFADSRDDD